MKTQHTTGPWNIEENADHYPFICDDEGRLISVFIDAAGTPFYGRTLEETKANAELIASAPDLLKENKELKDSRNFWNKEFLKKDELCAELLEALKSIRRWGVREGEDYEFVVNKMGEAIAKAEAK